MFGTKDFYRSVWRWHFFAGLYVVPFLVMLALTGLVMIFDPIIERALHADLYKVEQTSATPISYEAQYQLVAQQYPDSAITRLYVSDEANDATRFQVNVAGDNRSVFVDPYQAKVLGDISISDSWYVWADDTHGTFMLGLTGDWLIEIATSFTILLILTGVFMWWPKAGESAWQAATRIRGKGRNLWRDLHSVIGIWVAVILLFFSISGLAWASIWGGKMLQAWSTFPVEQSAKNVSSTLTHEDLNLKGLKQIPWNLEQAPLPESTTPIFGQRSITLDRVVDDAQAIGFTRFQLHFPKGDTGVFTTTASTMGRDINNALDDRTVHFDRYSGTVIADVGFMDYNWFAQSMAFGIALHMGQFGVWNLIACVLFCLAVILLCVSGVVMWWKRRPAQALAAPPLPKNLKRWQHAVWLLLPISLLFPMATLGILMIVLLDLLAYLVAPKLRYLWTA
ncbi:PepSY-associated TM helix domain-containing protein [Marinomonas ostreistagni]|uniref:PepSY-associated TM helix domain-containing protein n=1 Tax=Marinomonas ostreistagni TaxID=359209 RepID=UPI001952775C|nr:PepSY domain-containing protein [Marinomonas ostreistagni]MBM6551551.1 PepSY domain-containing protein [Marinomonas ostreistagni]